MEITVKVSERAAAEIKVIGKKMWNQTTADERKRYDALVKFFGTEVLLKVTDG